MQLRKVLKGAAGSAHADAKTFPKTNACARNSVIRSQILILRDSATACYITNTNKTRDPDSLSGSRISY